jgi:hypothetical protein
MNLKLATPILPQTIVPGEVFVIDFHVHEVGGSNFNWTGYTPKCKVTVGSVTLNVTGTVVSAGGGTATVSLAASDTDDLPTNSWGEAILYADPTASTANLHIATIFLRTTKEVIP